MHDLNSVWNFEKDKIKKIFIVYFDDKKILKHKFY